MTRDAKSRNLGLKIVGNNLEVTCKRFKDWVAKQRLPNLKEAAVDAYLGVTTSVFIGMFCEVLIKDICEMRSIPRPSPHSQFLALCGGYRPLVESFVAKGVMEKGNNIMLMRVCNASISFVLKNIRGKEDVQTSMVAGFGYGVAISLATGMRGPSVLSVGAICALFNGGMFKAGIKMWEYDHKLDTGSWRR